MLSIEGNIVTKDKVFRGRIEIDQSGMISKIGSPEGEADFIFKDELIFPGFIDLHVHAREDASHKQDYKEDFHTAGAAAINGGVVLFAEMPNNPVAPIDDASYKAKKELTTKCDVPVLLYGGIGPTTSPISLGRSPTGEAIKVPYKAFMGHSVGDLFFTSSEELEEAIKRYRGQSVSFHCEDPKILEAKSEEKNHEDKRPKEAEIKAVDFAIELIKKYDLEGKVCHASTPEGIKKIVDAKKQGVKITTEVTPHHLFFDKEALEAGNRISFQVNPPVRKSTEDRLSLISSLKKGDIDYLATDHAPHSIEEKEKGMSGLTHLDTYGPFVTWLMKEHNFTPEEITRVCSFNPGNFVNQFMGGRIKFGEIKEGYAGSLTIIDSNKEVKITRDKLKTKCAWSPFLGFTFPGSVVMTVILGEVYDKR